jgi:hypothetical protein
MRTNSGKTIIEEISDESYPNLTLEEAKEKFSSPLCKVIRVEENNKGTLSNHEACRIVFNEGLDYAVRRYISADEFKDSETRRLWREAGNILDALEQHIGYEEWENNYG